MSSKVIEMPPDAYRPKRIVSKEWDRVMGWTVTLECGHEIWWAIEPPSQCHSLLRSMPTSTTGARAQGKTSTMSKPKSPPKPTINELRAASKIPAETIDEIETLSVRMIQLQADRNALEEEKGYTDQDGHRHPGIEDRLQELFIIYDLPGVKLEDFYVLQYDGSRPTIDAIELANHGVTGDIIAASTKTSRWAGVKVQRSKRKRKETGDDQD